MIEYYPNRKCLNTKNIIYRDLKQMKNMKFEL